MGGVLRRAAANAGIRPIKLTDNQATPVDWVKDVAYNAAGQITTMSYARNPSGSSYYTETRQYNILQQLTRLTVPGVMDHEYRFSATQNDGRLTQRKDWVSGEEITYQYDSLNRLISAQTTGPEWGQSFGYDGFGNLLSQTVTKGSAPSLNVTVDPTTNRITNQGTSYDANGNLTAMPGLTMTYDTNNRMLSNSSGDSYFYDAAGQRVKKTNGGITAIYFYGVEGNLLNNWPNGYNVYFGRKLIYNSGAAVVTDRLDSVVQKDPTATRYFPYGDEPATTEQNRPKFATYFRDGSTALDYAQQRYYASTLGRFTSPDPYQASGGPADPQSWNRYAYVQNDPVNYVDTTGLYKHCPAGSRTGPDGKSCVPDIDPTTFIQMYYLLYYLELTSGVGVGIDDVGGGDWAEPTPRNPDCDKPAYANAVTFVRANREAAERAAKATGVPADFILTLSAAEVGWTGSKNCSKNNNYFNLRLPSVRSPSYSTGGWLGAVPCKTLGSDYVSGWACFPAADGFYTSGLAAMSGDYGASVKASIAAGKSYGEAAQIMADKGYDPGNPAYGKGFQGALDVLNRVIDCP